MDSLFQFAQSSAFDSASRVKKPDAQSSKITALEDELRSDTIEQKTSSTSERAGNASQPTAEQSIRLEAIGEQQASFGSRSNPLASYTTLLAQMQNDITGASDAMLYSTLDGKHENQKLANASEQYSMLATQFNLQSRGEESIKKARKFRKLSQQDAFL